MNLLKEFFLEDSCSYLQNRKQKMHYKIIQNIDTKSSQDFIERGYRRFGEMYFRPICESCNECQSIKIDVDNYLFSKSEKRVLKKASHLQIYIQKPTLTHEHLHLFEKYHRYMHHKKGWDYNPTSANHYNDSFVKGSGDFGYEVLYFEDKKLIGIDLIDILEDGISSIYFFYDPEYLKLSLGKFSLLKQIELAYQLKKKWIYLGYYVQECDSLSYKGDYKPYLTLEGRPDMHEIFTWKES
jgi:arginine-tRNA-protein transferase